VREDLIKIIGGQKDLTNVIITTFNIDFVFIENVLLRELRKCGHPTLTILADADEVANSFASQGRWVSRVGRRYRVVPIRMESGFRFHPKAVMLSGPEHAELLIGSGNLTFGGMRQNDEIWIRFDTRNDDSRALAAFASFAEESLHRSRRVSAARSELREAFDTGTHTWAKALGEQGGLLGRVGSGSALLDQITDEVADLDVRRIVIGSPYFDEPGDALAALAGRWPAARLEVLVQQDQSQLHESAWSRIRDPKDLVSIATSRGEDVRAFIHAKFYGFVGASEAVVFAGSANCSRAALTILGSGGNAELLAITRVPAAEFDDVVLSGVTISNEPLVLKSHSPEPSPIESDPTITILAAGYEHGVLVVEFAAPSIAQSVELLVDGKEIAADEMQITAESARTRWTGSINRVQVSAVVDGARLMSSEHWVDHEFILSATSRQRQMAQALGDHVSPGQWSFHGWTEVLRLLGDNLRYTPSNIAPQDEREPEHATNPDSVATSDFFTDDYRLPRLRQEHGPLDDANRVLGLRGLLLDYFGIDFEGDDTAETAEEENDDDETVDKQEGTRKKAHPKVGDKKKRNLTNAEQRRGHRITKQIIDTCASSQFIDARPASMLASDLSIAAVLLVSGHAERWLPDEDFLDLTYRMWSFLFFDDGTDAHGRSPNSGALARRHDASRDRQQFEESVGSVRLAASLATWCFCCPENVSHAEAARFQVATRLAVARLPWLWSLGDLAAVEKELFEIAKRTGWLGPDTGARWDQVHQDWNRMFDEGLALGRLEGVLLDHELADLRASVSDNAVAAGTLLWQGPKLGFCILTQGTNRRSSTGQSVSVLTLRTTKRDTKLDPSYLLPFRSLMILAAERSPERVTKSHVMALDGFANRLESIMSTNR
jgi:hypothetical protein